MGAVFAQIGLICQGEEVKEWMQVLPIILLAVFWAIGGILKAKANKQSEQDEEQDEALRQKQKDISVRQAAEKILNQQVTANRPLARAAVRPEIARKPRPRRPVHAKPIPDTDTVSSETKHGSKPRMRLPWLLAEADPENLKAAILHYEILGKCVALRGKSEQLPSI